MSRCPSRMLEKVWPDDELRALLDDDETRAHRLGAAVLVLAATGARPGEVLGLRWRDVNLDAGTVEVRQAVRRDPTDPRGVSVGAPKTEGSARVVPLEAARVVRAEPDELRVVFKARREEQAEELRAARLDGLVDDPDGLVFGEAGGRLVPTPSSLREWLRRRERRLGLPPRGPSTLRHNYATRAADGGVPPAVAREVLGHADLSTTLRYYDHAGEERVETVRSGLAAALGG